MQLIVVLASFLVLAKASPPAQPTRKSPTLRKRFIDVRAEDDDDNEYDYAAILAPGDESSREIAAILADLKLDPHGQEVLTIYNNSAFTGFSVRASRETRNQMRDMESIRVMEKHFPVSASFLSRPLSPWGLERISSGASTGDNPSTPSSTYIYDDAKLGQGSDIYIVDSGINTRHNDFTGRAQVGIDTTHCGARDGIDHGGHGSHVAGIAAGARYGVASNANIFGVKVLCDDGGGDSDTVLAGLNWIVNQHNMKKSRPGFVGSVASMSMGLPNAMQGGGNSATSSVVAYTTAIRAVVDAGVHVVVSAGNAAGDACNDAPADLGGVNSSVITVGAISFDGTRLDEGNTGLCVDLYAPGDYVLSDWHDSENATMLMKGTSMAAPHVTGIIAYKMAEDPSLAADPAVMKKWLKEHALRGRVKDGVKPPVPGDQGLLANNGVLAGAGSTQTVTNAAQPVANTAEIGANSAQSAANTAQAGGTPVQPGANAAPPVANAVQAGGTPVQLGANSAPPVADTV